MILAVLFLTLLLAAPALAIPVALALLLSPPRRRAAGRFRREAGGWAATRPG